MWAALRAATGLYWRHFVAIAVIVLCIRAPINAVAEAVYHGYAASEATESAINTRALSLFNRVNNLLSGLLDPIWGAGLVYLLARRSAGQHVSAAQALYAGVQWWGRLFVARLVAGLFIVLGLLLLVVPGVILMLRYFLLDCAVVLEGAGASESRARSAALTRGRKGGIFVALVLVLLVVGFVYAVVTVLSYGIAIVVAGEQAVADGTRLAYALDLTGDCVIDLAYAMLAVLAYAFYREATGAPAVATPARVVDPTGLLPCPNPECRQLNPPNARYCPRCGTAY